MSLRRLVDGFRERRPFPGQDPFVAVWDGQLLLIQSSGGDRRLVIHRIAGLHRMHRNAETVIWTPPRRGDHGRQLWAPELHRLGGRWYVYYAASDGRNERHRTYVLEAEHPLGPYRDAGRIFDPSEDRWAIDMTVLEHGGRLHAVWSGWEGGRDGPQNLYAAPMADPCTLAGGRRVISRPTHDWEMTVAPINEGPQVLRNPATGRLFLAYAADASWTVAYKTGLLEWTGGDVCEAASWRKLERPLLTGGGHGCFVETERGQHIVYHRKMGTAPGWADREIVSERVGWNADGYPFVGRADPVGDRRPAEVPAPPAGFGATGAAL